MKKELIIVSFALLIGQANTFAQVAPMNTEAPHIEVTGRSEMKVVPDRIHIVIDLKERGSGNSKVTVEKQEQELKAAVKGLGIDLTNLTLSDAMADLVPKKFRHDDVVASKAYELVVNDAEMVRKAFLELDRLQIEEARIDHVSHSKEVEFRKEMRIKAIQAAKDKADYLLAAINERTGAAVIVREEEIWPNEPMQRAQYLYNNTRMQSSSGSEEMGVSFSRITIAAGVYVKFGIAGK
jgi:uncharacterized protein